MFVIINCYSKWKILSNKNRTLVQTYINVTNIYYTYYSYYYNINIDVYYTYIIYNMYVLSTDVVAYYEVLDVITVD